MAQLQDPEPRYTNDLLHDDLGDALSSPQREGLPPGFRMRADAHYVDTLDAPVLRARDRSAPAMPARSTHAASVPASGTSTAVLESLIDDALRGVTAASALSAAASAIVRHGAADIIAAEAHRALRLLTAVRVVKGDLPVHRARVRLRPALETLARAIEREHALMRVPLGLAIDADDGVAIDGSEDLLLNAVYAIVTALGTAVALSASRHVQISAALENNGAVVVSVREHGLSIPEAWTRTAFDQPWPVANGPLALTLLTSARIVAERHGGSLSIHAGPGDTHARLEVPAASI